MSKIEDFFDIELDEEQEIIEVKESEIVGN